MARLKFKLNERGVSLLELTVSIGIGAMVTMLLVSAAKFLSKSQNNLQVALNEDTQTMLGDFFVTADLLRAGQSFNVLGACRSEPGQPVGFYDYDPMAPGCDGANPPADKCAPKVRLTVSDGAQVSSKEVVFLISKRGVADDKLRVAPAMRTLHPGDVYTMSGPPASANAMISSGTLDFGDGSKLMAKLTEFKMSDENAMIRFYSPYQGRRLVAGGNDFDFRIPPRNISLMGYIYGGKLKTSPPPFVECQASYDFDSIVDMNQSTPVGAFPQIDAFFRLLPTRTGLNGFAMVTQLEARRYKLYRLGKGKNPFLLAAMTWQPNACPSTGTKIGDSDYCEPGVCTASNCEAGSWTKFTKVYSGINSNFEFSRKSIRVPSFEFSQDVQ